MKINKNGQSLIELIFSITIIVMVLTGVVVLTINMLAARNKSFDRKKASRLAEAVAEQLMDVKKNDPEIFWGLGTITSNTFPSTEYVGFKYSVGFTNITGSAIYPNCGIGVTDCAEATIKIDWEGKVPQTLYFNRFFTRI